MSAGPALRQRRANDAACARYRFAGVAVDIGAHTVTRAGRTQLVEPKAFAVLEMLLENAGQLAGRDSLLDRVWGHRHVTPGVLTRAIAQLRHALGDDSHQPRLIATHHGLGYRFIAPVHCDARRPETLSAAPAEAAPRSVQPATLRRSKRRMTRGDRRNLQRRQLPVSDLPPE